MSTPVRTIAFVVAASLAVMLASCGGGSTCVAGTTQSCACAGGVSGVQTCLASGAFGTCDCGAVDGGPHDAGLPTDLGRDGTSCDGDGDGHTAISCGGNDCDDADANRYPGNPEVCDLAGHDEDCNPTTLGPDVDMDGFVSTACCNPQPSGPPLCGTDCDDTRATVNPSAVESCNNVDDNCNGMIDDGLLRSSYYPDCDADGFGDATATAISACATPMTMPPCTAAGAIWATSATDCDDHATGVHPGAMTGCECSATRPYDADHDGYASVFCTGADCDDGNGAVHPGATEICNGVDDDCDGRVDFPLTERCVHCDLATCSGTDDCCLHFGLGITGTCEASPASCSGNLATCDDDTDCGGGGVHCCVNGTTLETSCATTCPGGTSQTCHASTECPMGQTCMPSSSEGAAQGFCG